MENPQTNQQSPWLTPLWWAFVIFICLIGIVVIRPPTRQEIRDRELAAEQLEQEKEREEADKIRAYEAIAWSKTREAEQERLRLVAERLEEPWSESGIYASEEQQRSNSFHHVKEWKRRLGTSYDYIEITIADRTYKTETAKAAMLLEKIVRRAEKSKTKWSWRFLPNEVK